MEKYIIAETCVIHIPPGLVHGHCGSLNGVTTLGEGTRDDYFLEVTLRAQSENVGTELKEERYTVK